MSANGELDRILAFQATVDEGAAERVSEWEFGTAVLSPSLPRVWDANYTRLRPGAEAEAEAVAAAAGAVAGAAGMAHVSIVAREQDAARIGPGLQRLGFDRTRHVIMALCRRPDPPALEVSEVAREEVEASRAETTLEFTPGNHELVAQLAELDRRLARSIGGRWFAIVEAGEVASRAWLLDAGGIGQVEDVATTPSKRKRGYARAVVSAAAIASRDAGNDVTFIVADADDTVPDLYRRIGFEAIGFTERFVRRSDA
ncbi:MAG: hypothetical protein QOJ01_1227 [Solirubrobacterales bacterium]|jgi:GNAT superfamily N-acetyltransferase|nr:hypothetical protein [Solirubrobacterales bacterium]